MKTPYDFFRKMNNFTRLDSNLKFLPQELLDKKLTCPNGHIFTPDFLEKRHPIHPVKSSKKGFIWVPTSTETPCTICGSMTNIKLPHVKRTSDYYFFGDEAYREIEGYIIVTYSLVGANIVHLNKLEKEIIDFKASKVTHLNPDDWSIHLKEIWSSKHRKKNEAFKEKSFKEVIMFIDELGSLVKGIQDKINIYNSTIIYRPRAGENKAKLMEELKNWAYSLLVFRVMDQTTSSSFKPIFIFDSEKPHKDKEVIIHSWANNLFYGGMITLAYPFLSKGIEVEEPSFVKPASRPFLEIADFVSFIVARYLFDTLSGKQVNIDPSILGEIAYMGFDRFGNGFLQSENKFPWELYNK